MATICGLFDRLFLGSAQKRSGTGSPEASVTGSIGDEYIRTDGGTGATHYVKEYGSVTNTGWMPSGAGLLVTTATLTNAQIKALPTTPVSIIAAPGSGFFLNPIQCICRFRFAAALYTNIDAAAFLNIELAGGYTTMGFLANAAGTSPVKTDITTIFGAATNWRAVLHQVALQTEPASDLWGVFPQVLATTNLDNKALNILIDNGGSGDLTGGNAANTLTVKTIYTVEPI